MNKLLVLGITLAACSPVYAVEAPITGNVQTRCLITTDTNGVFGNPLPSKLSTAYSEGGVVPVVRYDVTLADAYLAKVTIFIRCCSMDRFHHSNQHYRCWHGWL